MGALEVWERCIPATAEHAYIAAKGGTPDGLRVMPESDTLTIATQQMSGALVVPVMPLAGGELVSLQFILPPGGGRKLNLPNAPMDGVFAVGQAAAAPWHRIPGRLIPGFSPASLRRRINLAHLKNIT